MTGLSMLLHLALATANAHDRNAGTLPMCSNRVVRTVVERVGCALGDGRCWARGGGFCTDYVDRRVGQGTRASLNPVPVGEVRSGDVAMFSARAHYAFVERVHRDARGQAVAVDLSESNLGGCWVDRQRMITERFGIVTRRSAVALRDVDGGFLRAPLRSAR